MRPTTVEVSVELREPRRGDSPLLAFCQIQPGTRADYEKLSAYHYRGGMVPSPRGIYRAVYGDRVVGVIVYAFAPLNSSARNAVFKDGRYLPGSDRMKAHVAQAINKEVETISRVVVHPTFRGIGLGVKLIRETLKLRTTRFVEMSAAMGRINPFAAKAGMKAYHTEPNEPTRRMLAMLRAVGIPSDAMAHPQELLRRVLALPAESTTGGRTPRELVETELHRYRLWWRRGRSKVRLEPDIEQAVGLVAANALLTPVYYIWESAHATAAS